MTQEDIHGHHVSFALRDNELLIQTRHGVEILELIPNHKFIKDLPRLFVEEYTHWINIKSGTIELRPLASLWQSCADNWRITCQDNALATMRCGTFQLVDSQSNVFKAVEKRLEGIESADYLHVMQCSSQGLIVKLPRYNFHFKITNDMKTFQSPELGATVEMNQYVGTLVGLQGMLVLKEADTGRHSILIPIGEVKYQYACNQSSHVVVDIDTSETRTVRYCNYYIDYTLRRLSGPPKLFQGYFLAYLHALTTHVLPDPFTGLTGTEQALFILQQACMLPTEPLNEEEVVMLELISKLTPRRKYYPEHLNSMQTVEWDPTLSMLSQHDDFIILARQFYNQSTDIEHFFTMKTPDPDWLESKSHEDLLTRARISNAAYCKYEFGGAQISKREDKAFTLRNPEVHSKAVQQIYEAAHLLLTRPSKVETCKDLWKDLKAWSIVDGGNPVFGSLISLVKIQLPKS